MYKMFERLKMKLAGSSPNGNYNYKRKVTLLGSIFLKKMGQPRPPFAYFRSFQTYILQK